MPLYVGNQNDDVRLRNECERVWHKTLKLGDRDLYRVMSPS